MRWKFVIPACFLAALLLATIPLRLALSWAGADRWVSSPAVEGTIWNGTARAGYLGRLSLGDARMTLDIPALLSGRAGFRFSAAGALEGSGFVVLGRESRTLRASSLRFTVSALSPSLPLEGVVLLSDVTLAFRDGSCEVGQGSVLVRKVQLSHGGMLLPPDFQLRGALGCAGRDVIMRLAGRSGDIAIRSTVRINADGAYRMENRVTGLGRAGDALAVEAGFLPEADGHARVYQGNFAL